MKKITLLFFSLGFALMANAQQWDWARKADATVSNESVNKIRSDGFGNLYLFGSGGGSKYGNTTLVPGYFIVKFDSSGTVIWAKNVNITNTGYYQISDFNVDNAGNIYFAGRLYYSLQILNFNFIGNGEEDIFLIKLDSSGTSLWGRSFGGVLADVPGTIAIDDAQNIYITGLFNQSISFDNHSLIGTDHQFFLTKLNSSGQTIWATKGDSCFEYGGVMMLDKYANIYVVESYECSYGASSIAKFDSSGSLLSYVVPWGIYDYVPAFVVSDNGNIFLLHNGGGHYGYVPILVKYDSLMNVQWSKSIGTYYGCYHIGVGVFIDKFENIYVGGSMGSEYCHNDSIYFQNQLAYIGHNGVPAIAKFNSSGNFLWIKEAISTDYDGVRTMSQDKSGNLYAAGIFNYPTNGYGDTLIFDKDTLFHDGNWSQLFIAKLNPADISTDIQNQDLSSDFEIFLFPNPSSGKFTIQSTEKISSIEIINLLGEKVTQSVIPSGARNLPIDLSEAPKGIYFVQVLSEGQSTVRKIVLN